MGVPQKIGMTALAMSVLTKDLQLWSADLARASLPSLANASSRDTYWADRSPRDQTTASLLQQKPDPRPQRRADALLPTRPSLEQQFNLLDQPRRAVGLNKTSFDSVHQQITFFASKGI